MANRKLIWWARLTFRKTCVHCGELYAVTTAETGPACQICGDWIADGAPIFYDDTDLFDAMDRLPWLLRQRPSVRLLNCSAATYREVAVDPQERADAYDQLRAEYSVALWPVRFAYNAGQIIGGWWDEACYNAGIVADWVRVTVTRPDCARCGEKATTTSRLRDDSTDRTPLCDDCCYAINDGAELPGGAR
jgi:hypothetical protein